MHVSRDLALIRFLPQLLKVQGQTYLGSLLLLLPCSFAYPVLILSVHLLSQAWRNQSGAPVNARTCKHLKELLGEKYEMARLMLKNPDGVQPAPSSKGAKAKPKSKVGKKTVEVLLANKWDLDTGPDPTGWWISEKLDGVR